MKTLFPIVLILFLSTSLAVSQEPASKAVQLNQELAKLYQDGNVDEGISVASQIVKLQRDERPAKTQNLINALENLAQLEVMRFKRESPKLNAGDLSPTDAKKAADMTQKDAAGAEANLREALGLIGPANVSEQKVGMQNNLAWLLYNYFPRDPQLSIGFDKNTRDKFDSISKARFYKRVGEAEQLYLDAEKGAETIADDKSDITLLSLFNLAEFELAMGKLEQALAHYEDCIARTEKRYGKTSKNLLPPLQSYAKALTATDQDDAAFDVLSKIVRISGKSAQMPKSLLNVSLRSEHAFESYNAPSVEDKAKANKESAELGSRGSILVSGGGLEAVQASSTFGRTYYENSGAVRMRRIPVRVVIDENGKVIEAEGLTTDKENKAEVERIVKAWTFRPFSRNGHNRKTRGYAECLLLAERF